MGLISPIGYPQLVVFFIKLYIGDLFSDSALPDSYIPNPQLEILSPIGDLISPIGDLISPIGDKGLFTNDVMRRKVIFHDEGGGWGLGKK